MNQLSLTRYMVETSHLVNVPCEIQSTSLKGLRKIIQEIADESGRDFGEITYRYELDDLDRVTVIHAYFTNRKETRTRFMRLRRFEQ